MFPKVVRNTAIQHSKEDEMALEGGDESIVGLSISLDGESIQLPEEASLQHHATTTTSRRVIQEEVTANQPTVRRVDVIVADGGIVQSRGQQHPRYNDDSLADDDMSSIETSVFGYSTQASSRDFRKIPSILTGDVVSLYGESTIQDESGTLYGNDDDGDDDMSLSMNSVNTSVYYDRGGHGGKNFRAGRNRTKAIAPMETSITPGAEDEEDELNKPAAMEGSACCKPWIKRTLVIATILLVVAGVIMFKGVGDAAASGSLSNVGSAPTSATESGKTQSTKKPTQSTKKPTKAPKQTDGDRQRRVSSSSERRLIRASTLKSQH
jgi:hypothetical protein